MSDQLLQASIDGARGFDRTLWTGLEGIRRLLFCLVVILILAPANQVQAAGKFKPFKLKTLDGATRTLEDYKNKATLIAFFFPSCTYCNEAFPETAKVYDRYKDQGLTMVWINVVEEEEEMIPEWLARHQYTVPVLVGATQSYLQRRYGLQMTPEHYILNADGEILFRQRGYKAGYETELEENVKQALNAVGGT